jgi:hypothetical protein
LRHPQTSVEKFADLVVVHLALPASRPQGDASATKSGSDPVWVMVVPLADRCEALPFVLVEPNDLGHDRIGMPIYGTLQRMGNGQPQTVDEVVNP